jgi:hypothetical protein
MMLPVLIFALYLYLAGLPLVLCTVNRCQQNCAASDRLTGPTRMTDTRPHPYKIAQFPTKNNAFCYLGCQYFFSDWPTYDSCCDQCRYAYRYLMTTGYSDVIQESINNCLDGCSIALQTCQSGFFCNSGAMLPCLPGTFRNDSIGVPAVLECTPCPYGRYRTLAKGKSPDECLLCPAGKYADFEGATSTSQCTRCPAGKFADEQGSRTCLCITAQSCNLEFRTPAGVVYETFYSNNIDYYRETIPYFGRW